MADYYPLIVRAVSGLEKNTGEGRRALYERARSALVAQLRGVIPPLGETEITRERLALEEAIRKVEAEAARRARPESPAPPPIRPSRETPRQASSALPEPAPPPPRPPAPRGNERAPIEPRPTWRRPGPPQYPTPPAAEKAAPQFPPVPDKFSFTPPKPPATPTEPRAPSGAARSSISDEGLKGFRDSVGTSAGLGEAAAAPPPQKKLPDAAPPASHDFDQLQNLDTDSLRAVLRNTEPRLEPPASPEMADLRAAARSRAQRAGEDIPLPDEPPRLRRSYSGLITPLIALGLAGGIAALTYWKRDTIGAFYQALRGPPSQAARDASPTRPKIADRIGPATQPAQQRAGLPAVAQRVVLYEEEQNDPQGKRYIGSAIWRTETVSPGPGQPPDLAIRADVEIPERQITMTFSLRRNSDQTLPASHTIEVMFNLPADFSGGGISNVPGVLMKQAEQTRGVPLAGLAVKVTTNFFLIGLSAVEADRQRNIALLKERAWFDIPIVYNNNRRAILAIEKGNAGRARLRGSVRRMASVTGTAPLFAMPRAPSQMAVSMRRRKAHKGACGQFKIMPFGRCSRSARSGRSSPSW